MEQPEAQEPKKPPEFVEHLKDAAETYFTEIFGAERELFQQLDALIEEHRESPLLAVGLEALDFAPVIAGYSPADIAVAVYATYKIIRTATRKDLTAKQKSVRIFAGLTELGASAIPGLPAAGAVPIIESLQTKLEERGESENRLKKATA